MLLAIPTALAASCAFMMPVATPPNAIVYGTGRVTIQQMATAGIWLNVFFVALLPVVVVLFAHRVFGS
jgi:sodium-dependent dicarboxylate transporter 2/3/5